MSSGVRVEAPDAARAFVLARMLDGHSAEVVLDGKVDVVMCDGIAEKDVNTVLAVVRRWVRDERVEHARVDIGDNSYTMSA